MDGQEDFYDIPSSQRTPTQTRIKLVDLAVLIVGEDKRDKLIDLVSHKTTPNGGNSVTDELKYTSMFLLPNLFVTETPLISNSQVLPSELDPRLSDRPLGWSRRG